MRVFHFTEQSYAPAWDKVSGPIRIDPPSSMIDPATAGELLNRYLDEWILADELGLDIMVNEHHTTLSCMSANVMMHLAVLARQTKRARLLTLGIPVTNRMDPFRIAEECALVDCISGGRLELGLVRGAAWELFSSNLNPVGNVERYWEAHDLILKAFAHRNGPFSWEGEHFHYRSVNLYPPIYQYPHPPMWIPGHSARTAQESAERGYICATFMNGYTAKDMFETYRKVYAETFGKPAPRSNLAYLCLCVVGNSRAEARARAEKMAAYLATLPRTPPHVVTPPGYISVKDQTFVLKSNGTAKPYTIRMSNGQAMPANATLEELIEGAQLFWGTPDEVYEQIRKFDKGVGGFGNYLMMGQAGYLSHEETTDSLRLFAREVHPRLRELSAEQEKQAA